MLRLPPRPASLTAGRTSARYTDAAVTAARPNRPSGPRRPPPPPPSRESRPTARRAAGQGQPEGLGPLGHGLEGVRLVAEAIEERPYLKDQGHERQEEVNPGLDIVNKRSSVHAPSLAVQSAQGLLQIGPKVLDVFDSDAQPDQVLRHADRLGRVPASSFDQGLHPAQRGGGQPQLQGADHPVRGIGTAEAAAAAAAGGDLQCTARSRSPSSGDLARSWPGSEGSPGNRMLPTRGGVLSRSARTAAEACERSIRSASVRSPRSASHASNGPGDPAVDGAVVQQRGAESGVGGHQGAQHDVGMAGQVLGHRVQDDVGAQRQRLLHQRAWRRCCP